MAELKDHQDRLEIYRRDDSDRLFAWRLVVNENIVATDAGQGYENELDAQTMAERILAGEFAGVPTWRIGDKSG